MQEAHAGQAVTDRPQGLRGTAPFILSGLSGGHGIFHWFTQSFFVMLPAVVATFGLSGIQVGAISTTREVVSGTIALPGGVVTDMLRRHWGIVMAVCMALFGVGWLVMGLAPVYPVLLVGMGIVAMAASVWHLPATAALSHHFSHRRGSALSFHGIGGNIGDVLGPALTGGLLSGVLLVTLTWRGILSIYTVVPILLSFLVYWAFRDIGHSGTQDRQSTGFTEQLAQTSQSFRTHPRLWGIMVVGGLRGMASVAFVPFLALYLGLESELGMEKWALGLHVALLVGVGVVSTPVMGYLSDRFGRKIVLIPGLLALCALTYLLVPYGEGIGLIIILALMGVFFFSDQPILTAAALDTVGEGVVASTLGVFSFSRFALAAASPLVAGALFDSSVGSAGTFYYIAVLYLVATVVLLVIPLAPPQRTATAGHHGHGHGHEHEDESGHGHEHGDGHGHGHH
jgi:MFS family permease